jgi:hypothetical protein
VPDPFANDSRLTDPEVRHPSTIKKNLENEMRFFQTEKRQLLGGIVLQKTCRYFKEIINNGLFV